MSSKTAGSSSAGLAQRLMERLSSMARYVVLVRQFGEIERLLSGLPRDLQEQFFALLDRELGRGDVKMPFTSTTAALSSDHAGQTSAAIVRARSENLHLRVRGLVLWVSTAWRETEFAQNDDFRELHRRMSKSLRLLRAAPQRVATAA